jgi:hypothetical protein
MSTATPTPQRRSARRDGVATTVAAVTVAIASCAGCSRRPPAPSDAGVSSVEPTSDAGVVDDVVALDPMDLVPGSIRAFGLVMPIGTSEHLSDPSMKMFYVSAPMSRVMRYLQRRLTITDGDIRPLGALIRRARVKFTPPGQALFVDVGLRDEGDRTFVTLWNRPALPPGPPVGTGESLRMAGFDPDSGRPLIGNHH